MLVQNVVSELTSDQPFLRSRACWLYGEFGDLTFADEESLKKAIDGIYKNLFAVELPVRLSACLALSKLLANKTTQHFLKPALQSIFEVYLKHKCQSPHHFLVIACIYTIKTSSIYDLFISYCITK